MASLLLGKGVFPFGFQDASEDLRYVTAFVRKDVPAVFPNLYMFQLHVKPPISSDYSHIL